MIDFRYHLVSIVAVFLALAIGIVVGATQLTPATQTTLDNQSKLEQKQIGSLRTENKSLQDQVGSAQEFAQAAAPYLLAGRLDGQRVVLVTAPGADSSIVAGLTTAVAQAGGKVTGDVGLQGAFFDTSSRNETALTSLVQRLEPLGFTAASPTAQLAANTKITAQQQAAQLIAAALVASASQDSLDPAALTAEQSGQVLAGLAQQGYLQIGLASGVAALERATVAVVVIPAAPPKTGGTDPANLALISVAYQLAEASGGGVVVAGALAGSGSGSVIDELVNGNTGVQISSVDNADTEQGQIMVAQALASLLAGQKPTAYGVGSGVIPSPEPTATPTRKSSG